MTRLEAFKHYESLLDSGEIESFRKIERFNISDKDFELLFYDDGGVMYNTFHGCLETYGEFGPSPELLKSLGHLGGERTRRVSDLTEEELEFFEGFEDDLSDSYIC